MNTPMTVIASWKAADWNETTRTASKYSYRDAETNEAITLTEDAANEYFWSDPQEVRGGGEQRGTKAVATPTDAELILECIERAFAGCVDQEATDRLDGLWEATELETARALLAEAGIEWEFESWTATAALVNTKRGQWAALWQQ